MKPILVRNKNIIMELLQAGNDVIKLSVVQNLDMDQCTKQIVHMAKQRKVGIERKPLQQMPFSRSKETHEVVAALVKPPQPWRLSDLLGHLKTQKQSPFFLVANRVNYKNNLGFIARTALAAGVNGIFFQGSQHDIVNQELVHLSLGTILRIPLVKMGIFTALKELERNAIRTYALDMNGQLYYDTDLRGDVAFVLGEEGEGLSDNVMDRCQERITVPMKKGLESLNVGASAAIIMYEKVRQEARLA